jgi:GTP-binding protein
MYNDKNYKIKKKIMIKIKSAEFIISAADPSGGPKWKLPEIAFSGRSNVGKSSLINAVLMRKSLVRTSSNPGTTRLLNYFLINENFYLVDLPGYGYAKASKTSQEAWKKFIEGYLEKSKDLKVVLQLLDIRHEFKENDKMMIEYLEYCKIPYVIILTKADKLTQSEVMKQVKYFSKQLPDVKIILTSSEKGTGKDDVLRLIESYL